MGRQRKGPAGFQDLAQGKFLGHGHQAAAQGVIGGIQGDGQVDADGLSQGGNQGRQADGGDGYPPGGEV